MEWCLSGRKSSIANRVYMQMYRGFESLSLQDTICFCASIFNNFFLIFVGFCLFFLVLLSFWVVLSFWGVLSFWVSEADYELEAAYASQSFLQIFLVTNLRFVSRANPFAPLVVGLTFAEQKYAEHTFALQK